jgi:hypothetical protein
MNPEFLRQVCLHFSPTRVVVVPALLGLAALAAYLSDPQDFLKNWAMLGTLGFGVLVFGMGMRAAGASVTDEITERTWDQQRMSAMPAWDMVWGKWAGSTAYSWYGASLCLLIAVPCAWTQYTHVASKALAAILLGVFLQVLLVAVNLQLVKMGGTTAKRGAGWSMLALGLLSVNFVPGIVGKDSMVHWWSLTFSSQHFTVVSLVLCVLCAAISAWRSMAEVLAVRQLPWAWPVLALVLTTYFSGFGAAKDNPVLHFSALGLVITGTLTFSALVTETQTRPMWERVISHGQHRQWTRALQQLPRWPTSLLLAGIFAALCTLSLNGASAAAYTSSDWSQYAQQPLALWLLMLRDCCIALFFAFAPQSRRPVLAFLVSMLVLYALLPWLAHAIDPQQMLLQIVLPLKASGPWSLVSAAVQAAVAGTFLRWRWNTTAI